LIKLGLLKVRDAVTLGVDDNAISFFSYLFANIKTFSYAYFTSS